MSIRTFLDTSVLIAAFQGNDQAHAAAYAILNDPKREFVTSVFVRLEAGPQAFFNKYLTEYQFYEAYFDSCVQMIEASPELVADAHKEAKRSGLGAMDALHVAAATDAKADELVTVEKRNRPFYRTKRIKVVGIRP